MIFEQHYLECLSQASYLIADETTGRAVVVDPRRDIDVYLKSAKDSDAELEVAGEKVGVKMLREEMDTLDPGRPTVVFCAGGYRSSIAASLLRHAGFGDVSDLLGGYQAWSAAQARAGVSG